MLVILVMTFFYFTADEPTVESALEDGGYITYIEESGLPEYYSLLNTKNPIYIEFTDVIQDRYRVNVEWFPDVGLAPFFTGHANINFKLVDQDIQFTVRSELFNIPQAIFKNYPEYEINREIIESKKPLKMRYAGLKEPPFEFRDINFDGTKELVIREKRGGQRFYDSFMVHLIQEGEDEASFKVVDLSDMMPYESFDETTEFDWVNETVLMYYSGGACSSSYETYKRVYSDNSLKDYQFELIKKIDYETWNDDGDIPCSKYVYDVVNGKDILIESESGPVEEIM